MTNFNMAANEGEKLTRQFILDRMDEKGITRYQLQQLTGLNRTTIGRWLDGETSISFNNYLKILGALEIRPYLVPAEMDKNEMVRMFFN